MTATVTYEEIKDLPNHPGKLLIDVRNPDEVQTSGQIPTSINIPCKFYDVKFSKLNDFSSDVEFCHYV